MSEPPIDEKLRNVHVGLRKDLVFNRQVFGKRSRYVVHDSLSFKNHMFSAEDYRIMTALVPERSLEENFARLLANEVLGAEDRQRFYEFVLQLHQAGILKLPITSPDVLFERGQRKAAARKTGLLSGMMYARVPLFNPDRFLDRTGPWFHWAFSKLGFSIWLGLMLFVFWTCISRANNLIPDIARMFAISNLPIIGVVLVGLKVFHEFGHAHACRKYGGEVPEMGVAFIVLTPYPYVDASASWKFETRWQRIVVGLAGMWVETFLAGIAALVWIGTPPGLIHDIALSAILLASLTTILANANPLLRFDGYYVLSDMLGVVNLSKRATEHLQQFAKRLFLGIESPKSRHPRREQWIYRLYGPASFAYKLFLAFAITALVLMRWSGPGLVLGALFCWLLILNPLRRLLWYLLAAEETKPVRRHAVIAGSAGVLVCTLLLMFCPVSMSVVAPGVLEPGVKQSMRAPANGFVVAEHVGNRDYVDAGDIVFDLHNPALSMQRLTLAGELEAELIRFDVEELRDATRAAGHKTRIGYLEAQVTRIDRRLRSMHMRTKTRGRVVSGQRNWIGRYVLEGEELCQVHSDLHFVRVVLTEEEVAQAHLEIGSEAEVQWNCDPTRRVKAVVSEIRRSASRHSVPVELTMLAGGEIFARQVGGESTKADQPYLHVFFRAESVPIEGGVTGLTARVRIPARLETFGTWLRRKLHNFYNTWKMS